MEAAVHIDLGIYLGNSLCQSLYILLALFQNLHNEILIIHRYLAFVQHIGCNLYIRAIQKIHLQISSQRFYLC